MSDATVQTLVSIYDRLATQMAHALELDPDNDDCIPGCYEDVSAEHLLWHLSERAKAHPHQGREVPPVGTVDRAGPSRDQIADLICHHTHTAGGTCLPTDRAKHLAVADAILVRWPVRSDAELTAQVRDETLIWAAEHLPMDCHDPRHMADWLRQNVRDGGSRG